MQIPSDFERFVALDTRRALCLAKASQQKPPRSRPFRRWGPESVSFVERSLYVAGARESFEHIGSRASSVMLYVALDLPKYILKSGMFYVLCMPVFCSCNFPKNCSSIPSNLLLVTGWIFRLACHHRSAFFCLCLASAFSRKFFILPVAIQGRRARLYFKVFARIRRGLNAYSCSTKPLLRQ